MHYAPHMWTSRPSPNLFCFLFARVDPCPEATKYSNGGLESRPVFSLSLSPAPGQEETLLPPFALRRFPPLSPPTQDAVLMGAYTHCPKVHPSYRATRQISPPCQGNMEISDMGEYISI